MSEKTILKVTKKGYNKIASGNDENQYTYIGDIQNIASFHNMMVINANIKENLPCDVKNLLIDYNNHVVARGIPKDHGDCEVYTWVQTPLGIASYDVQDYKDIAMKFNEPRMFIITNNDHFTNIYDIMSMYKNLYDEKSPYWNVKFPDRVESILSLLLRLPDWKLYIRRLTLRTKQTAIPIYNEIMKKVHPLLMEEDKISLRTQEEQIQDYLNYTSQRKDKETSEVVPDSLIEYIQQTPAYQKSLEKLTEAGFGISQTQQFNTLQSTGLFAKNNLRQYIFNLADMGSGKTLMTVQSIFLLDMLAVQDLSHGGVLKPKHVLAPELSLKGSWLETFKLFYNVTHLKDNLYEMSFEHNGYIYKSMLTLNGFTAKPNGLTVHHKVPHLSDYNIYTTTQYLIVDEVHQLLSGNFSNSKFFENYKESRYLSWFLSGTLSNLNTSQYYQLMRLFDIENNHLPKHVNNYESEYHRQLELIKVSIKKAGTAIKDTHHVFKEREIEHLMNNISLTKEKTHRRLYYDALYAPLQLTLSEDCDTTLYNLFQHTYVNDYRLIHNTKEFDAPNFELFYRLIGDRAITANSEQIAEELFGKNDNRHKAQIIKTDSQLSEEEIELLKLINRIVKEVSPYAKVTARKLANALLNLNDGLIKDNLYDIINTFAMKNQRFLEYLSKLPVDFLKKLQKSKFVQAAQVEKTEKYNVLQSLLKQHKEDTILIVVNDNEAVKALGKQLNIEVFDKTQLSDAINAQDNFNEFFNKQSIVIAPQHLLKSSLNLVQANVLIQFQLNTDVADMIQTQNRINRIGQKRDTFAYYIATNQLQNHLIQLFLETYRQIKVAHKGIVELFVDLDKQVNIVQNYLDDAFERMDKDVSNEEGEENMKQNVVGITFREQKPLDAYKGETGSFNYNGFTVHYVKTNCLLMPEPGNPYDSNAVAVLGELKDGSAHHIGYVGKDTPLYKKMNETKQPTVGIVTYNSFSTAQDEYGTLLSLNDSYVIEVM